MLTKCLAQNSEDGSKNIINEKTQVLRLKNVIKADYRHGKNFGLFNHQN